MEDTTEPTNIASTSYPTEQNRSNIFIVIGVITLLVLVAGGAFILGQRTHQNGPITSSQVPQITIATTQSIPSPLPTLSTSPDSLPQENVIYLDTVEGVDAVFFTNQKEQKYYKAGVEESSPFIGSLKRADGIGNKPFDYKQLTNPKAISLHINSNIQSINSIKLNVAKSMLYVSLNLEEKTNELYPNNLVNRVYQINHLTDTTVKDIWANDLGSNKYTGRGVTYINQIAEDAFVDMLLGGCYACEGAPPTEHIIVNVATKKEKYLKGVGDIQFELNNKTFSYKNLSAFKESCDGVMGCDNDGQHTVMKPAGQSYTESLP